MIAASPNGSQPARSSRKAAIGAKARFTVPIQGWLRVSHGSGPHRDKRGYRPISGVMFSSVVLRETRLRVHCGHVNTRGWTHGD